MRFYKKNTKIFAFFLQHKAYLGPEISHVDKSLYSQLQGSRDKICYLNLSESLSCIKTGLKVLSGIVEKRGKVLFVGGDISFISLLLCLSAPSLSGLHISSSDFSRISSDKFLDFVIVHGGGASLLHECESCMAPYMIINSLNIKGVTYPCSIRFKNQYVTNWYLYSLANSCRKGFYNRAKKLNEI